MSDPTRWPVSVCLAERNTRRRLRAAWHLVARRTKRRIQPPFAPLIETERVTFADAALDS